MPEQQIDVKEQIEKMGEKWSEFQKTLGFTLQRHGSRCIRMELWCWKNRRRHYL